MATSASSFDYPELFRERPYIYAVLNERATTYCHYCLKSSKAEEGKKLLRCSACSFAHYCDQQCQRAAWPDHKPECQCLNKMGADRVPTVDVRLLARMVFKRQLQYTPDERLPKDLQQQRPADLPNRASYLKDPMLTAFKNGHWKELLEYCGQDQQIGEDEAAFMYSQLFASALLPIFSCSGDMCAKGLYVGISALKPSCDPDVKWFSDGAEMVVRALKPGLNTTVPLQLTLDYLGSNGLITTRERRAFLAKNYRKCDCKLCLYVNRDEEMRAMICVLCREMTVPIVDDPKQTTAKCPRCSRQNDTTEAVQLMETLEPMFEVDLIEKMRAYAKKAPPSETDKWGMRALIEQARVTLSPVNAYASRLFFYYGGDFLSAAGDAQAGWLFFLMAWIGYERFDAPFRMNRVVLMKNIGQNCLLKPGDVAEKKKGIQLLLQAASLFKLYNCQSEVGRCLASAAEGSREVALLMEKQKKGMKKPHH